MADGPLDAVQRGENNAIIWTKNLRLLSKFTTQQIQTHLEGCGKKDIGSKGYMFFTESYIHDDYVGHDKQSSGQQVLQRATIKALCFRSQRKNEDPHKLILKCKPDDDGKEDAKVVATSCSCKAG